VTLAQARLALAGPRGHRSIGSRHARRGADIRAADTETGQALQDARLEVAAADEDPTDTFDAYRAAVATRDHAQDILGCTERQAVFVGDLPGAQEVCGCAGSCCHGYASILACGQDRVRVARFGQDCISTSHEGAPMADDHPTTEPDEDEYGKVDTGGQPDPEPASGEPVESDEFAHANDDD
jgi:hypothetical protein